MGIQTMGSLSNGQQSHLQPSPLVRKNSWYNLTLNEVENQLGNLGKPLGSMNLAELLNNVLSTESNQFLGMDTESTSSSSSSSSSSSLQRRASLTLARALSGKTVDRVWKEIRQGQKEMKGQEREATLGETTLEDFLVQAGLFVAETALAPTMELDSTPQSFLDQIGLSPTPSIGTLLDTPTTGQKRDAQDVLEKSIDERRLRRKIKNRESAARSQARKQAYHNELESKVSRLEEDNLKLKKEKIGLSPTPSIVTLSDTPLTGQKRDAQDVLEKSIDERRLRRKIKNRESAARSLARKQAYHNELESKVSRLEEDNLKLKKEKEFETKFKCETSEPKYQLRRTSSASF